MKFDNFVMKNLYIMLRFIFTSILFGCISLLQAQVIKFDNTLHDLGQIKENAPVTVKFRYTNTGKAPLVLGKAETFCDCTVPKIPKKPLIKGKSDYITVTFTPDEKGHFYRTVVIHSNALNGKISLVLQGTVTD